MPTTTSPAKQRSLRPVRDRIIVREDTRETRSKGGIYLPPSATDDKIVKTGVVLAVGPGIETSLGNGGSFFPCLSCKPGDHIVYNRYGIVPMRLDEQEIIILGDDDVMGVIEGGDDNG